MKFIYPAVIRKTEEGKFQASFPDLECCYAVGDTLEEDRKSTRLNSSHLA